MAPSPDDCATVVSDSTIEDCLQPSCHRVIPDRTAQHPEGGAVLFSQSVEILPFFFFLLLVTGSLQYDSVEMFETLVLSINPEPAAK